MNGEQREAVEPREGVLTVYDHEGRYVGCIGSETWQKLVDEEASHRIVKRWHSGGSVVGAECSCGWLGTIEESGEHIEASNSQGQPE